MELKELKYIKNTKQLPKFDLATENFKPTFKTRWNNGGGNAAATAATTGLNAAFQFNSMKTPANLAGDFIGKYGTNNYGSIDGINYQQYNDINTDAEEQRMSQQRDSKILQGASLGATTGMGAGMATGMLLGAELGGWGGPIGLGIGLLGGALLGGIFGNSSKHEEEEQMRIAQVRQNNANEFWRTGALSAALRNKELEQYGDTTRYNLFSGAALGAEDVNPKTGYTRKNHITHTAEGVKKGEANAKVDNGEIIENADGTSAHRVIGNSKKTDAEYADLKEGDKIASNKLKVPGTNMTFAQYYPIAKYLGQDKEFWNTQAMVRNKTENSKQKTLPRHWGGLENILATIPGMIQSWRDYKDISNDDIHRTQLNPFNPYERKAAEIMAGRTISAYPQMRAIAEGEAGQRYRINQSGGLSAMQKTMSNITNSMGSRIARANALSNIQQLINQYAGENAQLLNNMGNTARDATLRAQMFNEQQTAAAHASKVQGLNMAKRNMLDYATQFAKNAWEKNQFDRMMELYWADVNSRNNATKQQNTWSLKGDNDFEQNMNTYSKFEPRLYTGPTSTPINFNAMPTDNPAWLPVEQNMLAQLRRKNIKRRKR